MGITQEQLQIELLLKNNGIKSTLDSVINAMKKLGIASDKVDDALEGLGDEFGNVGKKANNSLNNINVNKLTAELNSVKTALKGISSSTTSEMNKVKASIASLDTVIKNQEKNISSLKTQIKSIGQSGGDTSTLEKQLVAEQNALTANQAKMKNYQGTLTELMNREQMITKSSNALKSSIGILNVGMNSGSQSTKELGTSMTDTTLKEGKLTEGTNILKEAIGKLDNVGLGSMDGFKVAMTLALESLRETAKNIKSEIKDLESKANSLQGNTKPRFGRANPPRRMDTYEDTQDEDVYDFDEKSGTATKIGTISGAEKKAYNETAKEVNNLMDKIESLTKDLNSLNSCSEVVGKTMRDVASGLEKEAEASEKASKAQDDLNSSNINNANSTNKLKNTLSQLTQKWRDNNKQTKESVGVNKQASQSFNTLGGSISNLMAKLGLVFGVYQLINFGKECLNLGSDLQEVQNVIDTVFPNATAQIQKWSEESTRAYGLSELAYKKTIGTLGAMARNFTSSEEEALQMSRTLTELSGDISSFYNISQDEALTKLKSVFTGETETMKDLGVILNQDAIQAWMLANGMQGTFSAMSASEQVAIRYKYVLDQLKFASGDFART